MNSQASFSPQRPFGQGNYFKRAWWRSNVSLKLIVFAVFQLNLQKVLYDMLGVTPEDGDGNPIFLLWAGALLLIMVMSVTRIISSFKVLRFEAMAMFFLVLCAIHGLVISTSAGIGTGFFAFLSWTIGIGVFLYIGRDTKLNWPIIVLKLFVFSGLLNAVPVIWESITDITIFKSVTLQQQTRFYGISQSVSILGMQLAVGTVATLYFLLNGKRRRFLLMAMVACQAWALVISTSRGPLIYMLLVIFIIAMLIPASAARRVLVFFMAGTAAIWTGLIVILSPEQGSSADQLGFVLAALTSTDLGNVERFGYYQEAFDLMFHNIKDLFIGQGAGMLSVAHVRAGGVELGVESSLLKVLLELGLLGAIPFIAIAVGTTISGAQLWIHRQLMPALFLTGCFTLILMQLMTHETLKAWIGSVYFWLIASAILHMRRYNR